MGRASRFSVGYILCCQYFLIEIKSKKKHAYLVHIHVHVHTGHLLIHSLYITHVHVTLRATCILMGGTIFSSTCMCICRLVKQQTRVWTVMRRWSLNQNIPNYQLLPNNGSLQIHSHQVNCYTDYCGNHFVMDTCTMN